MSHRVDFMRLQANHKRESIAALFATKDIPTALTAHLSGPLTPHTLATTAFILPVQIWRPHSL